MSSLNDLIKQWTEDLSTKESFRSEDLAELDQHLRSSIAELRTSGLSDEEAFLVASSRLGHPAVLEKEFGKVNGDLVWRRRIFWMFAGYVGLLVIGRLIEGFASFAAVAAAYAGANGTLIASASLLAGVLGWTCLFLWVFRLARDGGGSLVRQVRSLPSVVRVTGVLGCLLAGLLLPTAGQLMTHKLVSPERFGGGEALLLSAYGTLALQLSVPIICILVMIAQKRVMRSAA